MIKGSDDNFEVPVGEPISIDAKVEVRKTKTLEKGDNKTLEKGDNKVKEDKTLLVTECPLCKTEYRFKDIEELKTIKGYFIHVFTEVGSGVEVWTALVQCSSEGCGKFFVPTVKKIVYEVPKQPLEKAEKQYVEATIDALKAKEEKDGSKNNN